MAGIISYETGDIVEMKKKNTHVAATNGKFSRLVQTLK